MNRVDELRIGEAGDELGDRQTDGLEDRSKALAPMPGDEDQLPPSPAIAPVAAKPGHLGPELIDFFNRDEQRVDDRIPGDDDALGGNSLAHEVVAAPVGGSEV